MNQTLPDLVIFNANEITTLNSQFEAPRTGARMSELGIIRDGAIAVKNDKIVFIGTTDDLFKTYSLEKIATRIDASNQLVTPGFIDPHTHLIFGGSRENELTMKLQGKSYLEILASGGGILKTVRQTRNASFEELMVNGTKILDRMLRYGTTTVEIKSGYGLSLESEVKILEVAKELNIKHDIDVISTFLGAHAIPTEYTNDRDGYVDLIINNIIPAIAKKKLAEYCDVFCEEGIFSIDQTRKILKAAINYDMKPIIHIDEIVDTNGASFAAEMNVVQTGHLLKSNDKGLKAMSDRGIIATLLPGTPFCSMFEQYAPARKMIDLEIPIALATDLNPNCWTESMQFIMALACFEMKMTPAEALTAATINAACALQRQDTIGSLEVGKKADIAIFEVPSHEFLPYHFGVNLISKVIKNGKLVVNIN